MSSQTNNVPYIFNTHIPTLYFTYIFKYKLYGNTDIMSFAPGYRTLLLRKDFMNNAFNRGFKSQ